MSISGEVVRNPEELARQMARLTKAIRLATVAALESGARRWGVATTETGF